MKEQLKNSLGRVYLTIEYDAHNQWVYNNWVGYQSFESIVAGANACLDIIEKANCGYLLNDNLNVIGPWNHAVEWIATDWTPRAVNAGLQYFAHVVHPDSLAQLSSEEMRQSTDGFYMQIFGQMPEAVAWLEEHKVAATLKA